MAKRDQDKKDKTGADLRLLEVALDQFGSKSFDGASTRDIAKAADTAMSSITYHYGGKEGLYLATAEYVAEKINGYLDSPENKIPPLEELTNQEALETLKGLFMRFIRFFLSEESAPFARFIAREQMQPTEAFDIIFDLSFGKIADQAVACAQKIGGEDVNEQNIRIRLISLFGQALVFSVARQTTLRVLNWDKITPERALIIEAIVLQQWSINLPFLSSEIAMRQWSLSLPLLGVKTKDTKPAARPTQEKE